MAKEILIRVGLPDLDGDYDCSATIEVDGKPHYGGVCKFEGLMKNIDHYVRRLSKEDMKNKDDSTAWCPDCGDEMSIVQKALKPNEHWIYHCFGCDKHFQFKEV